MQPVRRRNFLQWIGAVCATSLILPGNATRALAVDENVPLLRTEHFEAGQATLQTAHPAALHEMLRDLHERRRHDLACHPGETTPNGQFLSGWIDAVTRELQSRGYHI